MSFVPIILAGGSGQRFWPRSTPERPKQFLDLDGSGRSLLQNTLLRLRGMLAPDDPIVVQTSGPLAELTAAHLPDLAPELVWAEPEKRDTAPAIAWSALRALKKFGPDTVIGYFPSDHWIGDPAAFRGVVTQAIALAASEAKIMILGIQPTRPATEYGYIERGEVLGEGIFAVERFCEKPDVATAQTFLDAERFFWNAGMFIVRAGVLVDQFREHAPDVIGPLEAQGDTGYAETTQTSFDYAVMEKTNAAAVVAADCAWDDLGDWNAVARFGDATAAPGVAMHNCESVVVDTGGRDEQVAVIGLNNVVIVRDGNRTLVAARDQLADIKKLDL